MSGNPFRVLGLSSQCTQLELKKRYRELSRKYHPDVLGTGNAEKFSEILIAYKEAERLLESPRGSIVGTVKYRHTSLFNIKRR